jgi:hypothetical protein
VIAYGGAKPIALLSLSTPRPECLRKSFREKNMKWIIWIIETYTIDIAILSFALILMEDLIRLSNG